MGIFSLQLRELFVTTKLFQHLESRDNFSSLSHHYPFRSPLNLYRYRYQHRYLVIQYLVLYHHQNLDWLLHHKFHHSQFALREDFEIFVIAQVLNVVLVHSIPYSPLLEEMPSVIDTVASVKIMPVFPEPEKSEEVIVRLACWVAEATNSAPKALLPVKEEDVEWYLLQSYIFPVLHCSLQKY